MKKIMVFLIFFMSIHSAHAITLDEAIKTAVENSEAANIAVETSKTIKAQAVKSAAPMKPQVSLSAGYTHLETTASAETSVFTSPSDDYTVSASASQLLFQGRKIWYLSDLEKTLKQYSEITKSAGFRDIKKNVKTAFDNVLLQRALFDILEDRVKQRKEELKDAQDLKEVGMVTNLDVRQAQLNLNFAQEEMASGGASCKESRITFNNVIGKYADGDLEDPEGQLLRPAALDEKLRLLQNSLSSASVLDIRILEKELQSADLNYKLAHSERYPSVNFVTSADSSGENLGDVEESLTVGLQVNWSVFSGGLIKANEDEAKAKMRLSKEKLNKLKKDLSGVVSNLVVNADAMKERIRLQEEAVNLSHDNYKDAREHYRAGAITLTGLGDFNLDYAEARFKLANLIFLERAILIAAEALSE
ncbi:outer membrane efflux protein [Candidatus Magnetoovum chiemensis]|nr:outer membrane efflux protein [Candidatus Magnetoovum chiemensis]